MLKKEKYGLYRDTISDRVVGLDAGYGLIDSPINYNTWGRIERYGIIKDNLTDNTLGTVDDYDYWKQKADELERFLERTGKDVSECQDYANLILSKLVCHAVLNGKLKFEDPES